MPKLGVNIDHVATLRQARREFEPDPIEAARLCEQAGADSVVAHLREDRRHIQDRDILVLRKTVQTRLNLEMSAAKDILRLACLVRPHQATLVPERRQEITTEGGLDVCRNFKRLKMACRELKACGIAVSLFIAADRDQIHASRDAGAQMVELHTGEYSRAFARRSGRGALQELARAAALGQKCGLSVNAGHGLNYSNAAAVAGIPGMEELNIGHAIIARAVFVGLKQAVEEMVRLTR